MAILLKRGSVMGLLEEEEALEPFGCFCFVEGMVEVAASCVGKK